MRHLMIAAGLLGLVLHGSSASAASTELIEGLNAAQSEALLFAIPGFRRMLDEQLLDYPSARFSDTIAVVATDEGKTTVYVCGSVNARNRIGGYVGWRKFAMFDEFSVIEGQYPAGTRDAAYANSTLEFACKPGKKGVVGITHWDFSSRLQFAP